MYEHTHKQTQTVVGGGMGKGEGEREAACIDAPSATESQSLLNFKTGDSLFVRMTNTAQWIKKAWTKRGIADAKTLFFTALRG